jgi:hypothetical protein
LKVHDEWTRMPRVSAFHGIVIEMYFNESPHSGRPHFHAKYAGASASYDIETLEPIVRTVATSQSSPGGQVGPAPSGRVAVGLGTLPHRPAFVADRPSALS